MQSIKDKFNVVCGGIKTKLDLRFHDNKIRDEVHLEIVKILQQKLITTVEGKQSVTQIEIVDDCPAFQISNNSHKYISILKNLISKEEKIQARALHSGGASDVNYMSHKEAICIDGLGAIGGNMHTNSEYIQISSLKTRSQVLSHFLKAINNPLLKVGGGLYENSNC